ncbi:hypothetical protein B0A48_17313 [Cryoendolithus antarcticus]|uniref:Uncharacterized protein n=1 Tax=Cryoendolithus antarcticus TaxID=1507870 RepID=A0A1V8SC65_9PEZI|nr:hypothetical protein B0A48_17313 [Cryoendolithus antarcticus]
MVPHRHDTRIAAHDTTNSTSSMVLRRSARVAESLAQTTKIIKPRRPAEKKASASTMSVASTRKVVRPRLGAVQNRAAQIAADEAKANLIESEWDEHIVARVARWLISLAHATSSIHEDISPEFWVEKLKTSAISFAADTAHEQSVYYSHPVVYSAAKELNRLLAFTSSVSANQMLRDAA